MELLSITVPSSGISQFAKAGRYFEIVDSTYPIDVDFTAAGGQLGEGMHNAISGMYMEQDFSAFSIRNTSAAGSNIVTLLLMERGRGGSRKFSGRIGVASMVGVNTTYLELASGLGATGFIATSFGPTIGLNVRGCLIRKASVSATAAAGGTAFIRLVAAPTTPVAMAPPIAVVMADLSLAATLSGADNHVDLNYQLPTGWGVWIITQHTVNPATAAAATLNYEVL